MKYISLCTLYILAITMGYAQNSSVLFTQEKADAEKILDVLFKTYGDYSKPKPSIKISKGEIAIAEYNNFDKSITIDSKVFDICKNAFPRNQEDALAFIIGHELGHYLQFNTGIRGFAEECIGDTNSESIEREADKWGLFTAYISGYQSIDILPELIDNLYSKYNLPDLIDGSPNKKDRKQIDQLIVKEVGELVDIFETANYLSAIGSYRLAASSYEHILTFYKGKEIYNNLAVNFALAALNIKGLKVDEFIYPLEIDFQTRLKKNNDPTARSFNQEDEIEYEKWLSFSKDYLLKISESDDSYFIDDINLLSVYGLLGITESDYLYKKATKYYEENDLIKMAKSKGANVEVLAKLQLAYAINSWKMNTKISQDKAIKVWKNLSKHTNSTIRYQAKHNLAVSNNDGKKSSSNFSCPPNLYSLLSLAPTDLSKYHFHGGKKLDNYFSVDLNNPTANSSIYVYSNSRKKDTVLRLEKTPIAKHRQKSINLQAYNAYQVVYTSNGSLLICRESGFGVLLDNNNKTTELIRFHKEL